MALHSQSIKYGDLTLTPKALLAIGHDEIQKASDAQQEKIKKIKENFPPLIFWMVFSSATLALIHKDDFATGATTVALVADAVLTYKNYRRYKKASKEAEVFDQLLSFKTTPSVYEDAVIVEDDVPVRKIFTVYKNS